MPNPKSYSKTQIVLHWLIVLAVLFQFFVHDAIAELWEARMEGEIANAPSPDIHAAMGIVIFALMAWRVWLRFSQGAPALPAGDPALARILSQSVQGLLYLSVIAMPLSGAVGWFFGVGGAIEAHGIIKNLILLLVALHIAGALAQHFVFKSNVLMRMLGRA
ncbi:MAG: cytochrome b/b6 domain-containing protein [Alphaproteobacteria bacterium]|nr:cytochrome b/b6 domain-containing protein [Alphaproteobacteria bacterium]